MKKKQNALENWGLTKLIKVMKITLLLIFIFTVQTFASSYAQSTKLSLSMKDVAFKDFITYVEAETEFYFMLKYDEDILEKRVDLNYKNAQISEILDDILANTGYSYKIIDRYIAISKSVKNSDTLQQKSISGTVTDPSGSPLPGVNIVVKGTTRGTITDADGNYSLSDVSGDATLVFSFVGYLKEEIEVADQTVIDLIMVEDILSLDEVVVVGYGVQKKVDLTGSVEVIKNDVLMRQPIFQTSQALVGLAPGLTAIQSSGQPGSDASSLIIRGIGSLSASSSPLVLVDGVEGSINGVDVNDIESISVLKDAGASAIYGSRASNGVILVTTKRAKAGKVKIAYNGYIGFQEPTNQPEFVNAVEYLKAMGDEVGVQNYLDNPNDHDNYPDTDWVDLLFSETGFTQYHNIDVSGGSESARLKATISYQDQDGNIPTFGFKRYQGRFNSDFKFSEKLNVSFDLNFRQSIHNSSPYGTGVEAAYRQPAVFPAVFSDERYALPSTGGNPIAGVNKAGININQYNYFRGLIKGVFKPIPSLSISVTYTPEFAESYDKDFSKQYEVYENFNDANPIIISSGINNNVSLSQRSARSFVDNFTSTATYMKDFSKHHLEMLAGYEFIKARTEAFAAGRYGYIIQDFDILDNGNAENDSNSGSADHYGLVSYFGRLTYNFDNRYLFGFNIRRDGSSHFAPENRWGIFPSFSAGWNIHNESFFSKDIFINRLKLRGSWGQLGNQSIGYSFPYASLIVISSSYYANGEIQQGAAQQRLSNAEISWETGETTNIGIDFGIFDNRLTGTVEYYIRKTNDLLGTQLIPSTTGLGSPIANVYSMQNSGFDISVGWHGKVKDLNCNISANFSALKNEVTDLHGVEFIKGSTSITQVGEPVASIYGYESIGLFADQDEIDAAPKQFGTLTPGDIRFKDQLTVDTNDDGIPDEADGIINADDRVILGNPFPGISFGMNIELEYKGFDLFLSLQGVGERDVLLSRYLVQPLFNAGNITRWQLEESWTENNLNASFPVVKPYSGASNNSKPNSTYVFDASYLRFRNLTVGYTLPRQIIKPLSISSVRIFASGQNLLTFDKMPQGIDPLIPNNSIGNIYPIVKSYTFGVNVTF